MSDDNLWYPFSFNVFGVTFKVGEDGVVGLPEDVMCKLYSVLNDEMEGKTDFVVGEALHNLIFALGTKGVKL